MYGLYDFYTNETEIHQVNGLCNAGRNEQYILIHWTEKGQNNLMNLTFRLNQTTREYTIFQISFELSAKLLPEGANEMLSFYHSGDTFKTHFGMSYHCSQTKILKLRSSANSMDRSDSIDVGTASFSRIWTEGFRNKADRDFSIAIDCTFFKTPSKLK